MELEGLASGTTVYELRRCVGCTAGSWFVAVAISERECRRSRFQRALWGRRR
jgi:hypothetical protein